MNKKVICCGNIAYDLIATPGKGPANIIFRARPGGSVLNVSIILSRLGINVSMMTKSGKDFLGDCLVNLMKHEGINTNLVFPQRFFKTGLAIAKLDENKDSSYIFYKTEGEITNFKRSVLDSPNLFRNVCVFHTGSAYSYKDFSFYDSFYLIRKAKDKGVFTSYDPNWREGRIRYRTKVLRRIGRILPYIDLLKLSESDAIGITGQKTLSAALNHLPANIFVTLGSKGSLYWDGSEALHIPAFDVKVSDTIGAGDSFTAGLIYMLCTKGKKVFWENPAENIVFASAVAALACRGTGSTDGVLDIKQVMRFIRSSRRKPFEV